MRKGESQFSLISYAKDNKLNVFYVVLIFLNNFAYGMSVNIIVSLILKNCFDLFYVFHLCCWWCAL